MSGLFLWLLQWELFEKPIQCSLGGATPGATMKSGIIALSSENRVKNLPIVILPVIVCRILDGILFLPLQTKTGPYMKRRKQLLWNTTAVSKITQTFCLFFATSCTIFICCHFICASFQVLITPKMSVTSQRLISLWVGFSLAAGDLCFPPRTLSKHLQKWS